MATLLLVEDDELISASLSRALRANGHEVKTAATIVAAEAHDDFDLILCDLTLPDGDGLDFIGRAVVRWPAVPVIILTARREETDVVTGLSVGAIDYVVKPFRLAELLARIDAQLRRGAVEPASVVPAVVVHAGLVIDRGARRVTLDGRELPLRRKEFELLSRLDESSGRVVRREELIRDVWGENWWGSTKTLDVHVNALRRKLGEEPGGATMILSIRGVGYRLDPP
ncbi:MAG: response regulator transcription factor [Ilumatobacteraceae bacterium]